MEFEDLQVIWDSQNERALYAIDDDALHAVVRKRGQSIETYVSIFEIAMILVMLTVGIASAGEPLLYGHDYHQLPGAALCLLVGGYLLRGRLRRRRSDALFEDSLLGDLDKAIARIDYQIARLRSFLWWFIIPMGIGSAISFAVLYDSKPVWIWPLTVLAMLVAWGSTRRDLYRHALPKKRELESLREKLVADPE